MKKYLMLFLMAGFFSLAACSDDDEVNDEPDPIVGTWVLIEVDPASPMIDPAVCDPSTITFEEDGSAFATFYIASNNCGPVASPGSWDHKEGSTYSISVPFVGSQDVNVNFDGSGMFSMELEETTLTFEKE
ncbi:MAG TPA: lipocalin family protein [Salinimicrobium sp.]|nr:lipocalin family protein [Salinimicrobium sp.]